VLYYRKISKNKAIEISSLNDFKRNIFNLNFVIERNQSHAGFHFLIAVFTWMFEFNIYDIRHWNYDNNCWEVYVESEPEPKPEIKEALGDEHENNMGIGA